MPPQQTQPPTIASSLKLSTQQVFVRTVARGSLWAEAKQAANPQIAEDYLIEEDQQVSLWSVNGDDDLRRVAIAINESRDSPRETIDFLTILPDELSRAGLPIVPTPGETSCPAAAALHFDATFT